MMQLIRELARYEEAPNEVTSTEQMLLEQGFGDRPVYIAWVAEQNQVVLGLALCYIRYSTWKGPVLYLEDLIVTESSRGLGMGKALFDVCISHARAQNYSRLVWQVLDWNLPAIAFYRKYNANLNAGWVNAHIDF